MRRTRIAGTGFFVPERVVTNDDLAKLMDTSDEWIRQRSGIVERRFGGEHETPADLAQATGLKVEPEGLCRGDACVRTQPAWTDGQGRVDLAAFAAYMGQPMLHDGQAYAFGESLGKRRDSLFSLEAPDFCLPDIDGKLHKLSDFRGKKVFMYSWGSY